MDFISHISFSVSDFAKSLGFYDAVMNELGHKRLYTSETGAGWGRVAGEEIFEIKKRVDKIAAPSRGFHLAFHAETREQVRSFHSVSIKNGGQDNGAPGPRPEYGQDYYAAFVIDPDGYELEAKLWVQARA